MLSNLKACIHLLAWNSIPDWEDRTLPCKSKNASLLWCVVRYTSVREDKRKVKVHYPRLFLLLPLWTSFFGFDILSILPSFTLPFFGLTTANWGIFCFKGSAPSGLLSKMGLVSPNRIGNGIDLRASYPFSAEMNTKPRVGLSGWPQALFGMDGGSLSWLELLSKSQIAS